MGPLRGRDEVGKSTEVGISMSCPDLAEIQDTKTPVTPCVWGGLVAPTLHIVPLDLLVCSCHLDRVMGSGGAC